jgi:outer membrane protein assembly factor BamB
MNVMTRSFLCLLYLPAALSTALADWPTWRGAHRDGISRDTGLLQEWTDDGPPLAWKLEGLGEGMSSVAITDGRLYLTGRRTPEGGKQGTCLIAIDLASHKELWSLTTCEGGDEPNGTPTVAGGLVFVIDRTGNITAADAATGKRVWQRNMTKDFGGKMESGWGWSESPLVDGDKVIVTPGGPGALLVALDRKSGRTLWKSPTPKFGDTGLDGAAYSSVVIGKAAGRRQYVQLVGRAVVGVDPDNGQVLWHYGRVNNGTANIPTPLVWDDHVFVSTGYGSGAALLKIVPDGKGLKAEEVYFLEAKTFQNHHGGMILHDGHIYAGTGHNNGFPICLDAATGTVKWGGDRHSTGKESAAVTLADGRLYFRYQNGIMALIDASPAAYTERGSFKLAAIDGPSWPHPVVDGGRLYIRSQGTLLCYDVRKQ